MRSNSSIELSIPSTQLTQEMVQDGTVTLCLQTEDYMDSAITMVPRRMVSQRVHLNPGLSLHREKKQRPLIIHLTALVEIVILSETMDLKQTIEASIANLREDCVLDSLHQIWMHELFGKETLGAQMLLTIPTGRLCKLSNKTTRYLMNKGAALNVSHRQKTPQEHANF